jgi:hypothetical protein
VIEQSTWTIMPDIEKETLRQAQTSDPSVGSISDRQDVKATGTMPDSSSDAAAELAKLSEQEYNAMERKLLRKIDRKLIPWMTCVTL